MWRHYTSNRTCLLNITYESQEGSICSLCSLLSSIPPLSPPPSSSFISAFFFSLFFGYSMWHLRESVLIQLISYSSIIISSQIYIPCEKKKGRLSSPFPSPHPSSLLPISHLLISLQRPSLYLLVRASLGPIIPPLCFGWFILISK